MDGRGREASRGRQTETKGGSPHPGTSVQRESSKAVYILYSPRLSTLTGHLTVLSLSVHPDSPPPVRTVPPGDPRSPLELTTRAALDTPGTEEAPPPSRSRRVKRPVAPLEQSHHSDTHTDSSVAREARRQKDSSAYTLFQTRRPRHSRPLDRIAPALTQTDPWQRGLAPARRRPFKTLSPPRPRRLTKYAPSRLSLAGPDTLESLRCTGSNPDGRLTAREDF